MNPHGVHPREFPVPVEMVRRHPTHDAVEFWIFRLRFAFEFAQELGINRVVGVERLLLHARLMTSSRERCLTRLIISLVGRDAVVGRYVNRSANPSREPQVRASADQLACRRLLNQRVCSQASQPRSSQR